MSSEVQRKLTTILAADAEGYSREMESDEVGAFNALQDARGVFFKLIQRHQGRIANTAGDGLIAEFPSVVEAVQCAIEIQRELGRRRDDPGGALNFRIGIHLGDVIVDGDDLLGEGVNLAARLQSMAEPGGILLSQQVYDQVHTKLSVGFDYLGEKRPKNYSEDVPVYGISSGGKKPTARRARHSPRRPEPAPPQSPGKADMQELLHEDLQENVIRDAKRLGAIWIALVVIDLVTGPPFWAHYPGIGMAMLLGLKAAPLFSHRWFGVQYVRLLVIVAGLALINTFTWSGYLWVIWPAGAMLLIEVLRRTGRRRH